ncbi:hypothetical protein [Nonlabens antarcticus]|uniref:hypothetical protein n=1 Tax=Nonlabens antarcticus TaxID=392714 RepID=UPI001890C978|nr:hypothetical protein [Nonlabens antarcticus]
MNKAIVLISILFFISSCTETPKDKSEENNQVFQQQALEVRYDSLLNVLSTQTPESNYWFNKAFHGKQFEKHNIDSPEEFIEKTLRSRPELIPLEAVLGGKMHFVRVQLLGAEWLIADYEDGHILGRSLYKYQLSDSGELEFELIESVEPL